MTKKELVSYATELNSHMLNKVNSLQDQLKEANNKIDELNNIIEISNTMINKLQEQLKLVISAKYQSQRNKVDVELPTLFDFIDEADAGDALVEAETETKTVKVEGYSYTKDETKKVKEEHIDYSHLEHVIEEVEIPDEERICPVCGSKMAIKKYNEKEELVYEPARLYVRVERIPVLECVNCQSENEEGKSTYHVVAHRKPIYPRSIVSPELMAYIIDMKYNVGVPLYTLEKKLQESHKILIPRQNMTNWVIGLKKYIQPLYNLMKKDYMSSPFIHADETPTQVLNEEGKPATSKSYMFVYRSNKYETPIVLYDYRSSRSGDGPKEFLEGYQGTIGTDAYDGYNSVEGVIRAMCNAHALRKFKDSYKLLPKCDERKNSDEAKAITKYQEIFTRENKIQKNAEKIKDFGEKIEYIQKNREKYVKPLFEKFLVWLEEIQLKNLGKYSMSNAISYTLNHKVELMRFIEDGLVAPTNNITEQSIRPFVVTRNRCKFYVGTNGAEVSALIYSLVITCQLNRIDPYMYFTYILERLPSMDLSNEEELRKLLPYSDELPEYVRTLTKKEIRELCKKQVN